MRPQVYIHYTCWLAHFFFFTITKGLFIWEKTSLQTGALGLPRSRLRWDFPCKIKACLYEKKPSRQNGIPLHCNRDLGLPGRFSPYKHTFWKRPGLPGRFLLLYACANQDFANFSSRWRIFQMLLPVFSQKQILKQRRKRKQRKTLFVGIQS